MCANVFYGFQLVRIIEVALYHEEQQSRLIRVCGLQKLMQKIWTLFTSGNGQLLFRLRTKLHQNMWIVFVYKYLQIVRRILSCNFNSPKIKLG